MPDSFTPPTRLAVPDHIRHDVDRKLAELDAPRRRWLAPVAAATVPLLALGALAVHHTTTHAPASPPTISTTPTASTNTRNPPSDYPGDLTSSLQSLFEADHDASSTTVWDHTGVGTTSFTVTGTDVHHLNVAYVCTNGPHTRFTVAAHTSATNDTKVSQMGRVDGCDGEGIYGIGSPALSLKGTHTLTIKLITGPQVRWHVAVALTHA